MKKTIILCAGLCLAMAFASCGGSKESAYKKAYEKAKAQEAQQTTPVEEAPVVTPLVEKPATQTTALWSVRLAQRPTLSVFSSVLRIRAMLHRWLTTLRSTSTVLSCLLSTTRQRL